MQSPNYVLEDEMSRAISLEKNNQSKLASKLYEGLLKRHPLNENILTRLIINYRKIKDYKKELKHINSLLKVHEAFYSPKEKKEAIVISISEKLNKLLGGTDKRGNKIYADEAIKKLQKRKLLVEEKYKLMQTKS
jgi:hypothetical protein